MIWYIPLEHIDSRYTVHLDRDITDYLIRYPGMNYIVKPFEEQSPPPQSGMFLNAGFTIKWKSAQIKVIAQGFENGLVNNGDIFFFSDIWHPGIESLAYMAHFYKKNIKIRGILHAGSFTDTDEVRKMERWAKNFEEIVFDICDEIYVASDFIRSDVISKRMINPDKLIVTPLPLDKEGMDKHKGKYPKENIIIFNGRNHPEKQPHLFKELERQIHNQYDSPVKFIWTLDQNLSKDEYYALLAKSKGVVSFALQENFGYGIAEAVYLGCVPVLPGRLVYPEIYPSYCLYESFEQCVYKIKTLLERDIPVPEMSTNQNSINRWFL